MRSKISGGVCGPDDEVTSSYPNFQMDRPNSSLSAIFPVNRSCRCCVRSINSTKSNFSSHMWYVRWHITNNQYEYVCALDRNDILYLLPSLCSKATSDFFPAYIYIHWYICISIRTCRNIHVTIIYLIITTYIIANLSMHSTITFFSILSFHIFFLYHNIYFTSSISRYYKSYFFDHTISLLQIWHKSSAQMSYSVSRFMLNRTRS